MIDAFVVLHTEHELGAGNPIALVGYLFIATAAAVVLLAPRAPEAASTRSERRLSRQRSAR